VDFLFDHFGFSALAKFNGGAYYFTRTPEATAFYETSRDLMTRWQELRLAQFHGGGPGEEAIYGIAMAIHGIRMTSMGNGGMWTPFGSKGPLKLDVLHGTCSFEKEGQMRTPEVGHFPRGVYL
jgi:hypothetical protein